MPVYEFLCAPCNRIYSFHSFRVDPDKVPTCPKCHADDLRRVPSRFGVSVRRAAVPEGDGGDLEDPRLEREMMKFAAELEGMDENNPRHMAAVVRKMTELAGEGVTPAMEEMIRRLEAGEDPERIEEELGDAIEEEMGEGGGGVFGGPPPTRDEGLYPM
jgi:putative FmdB family regulatory protein